MHVALIPIMHVALIPIMHVALIPIMHVALIPILVGYLAIIWVAHFLALPDFLTVPLGLTRLADSSWPLRMGQTVPD